MRRFVIGVIATILSAVAIAAIVWFLVMPRLDWGADQEPTRAEVRAANRVLLSWVRRQAPRVVSPIAPTADNLKHGKDEYSEHCAICHGLDGSGNNSLEAQFYPPVPKLTGGVQQLSDGELYFIVAHGIRNTAMPSFGKEHSPDDIWRCVLWIRHLNQLTVDERASIEREMGETKQLHENTMEH